MPIPIVLDNDAVLVARIDGGSASATGDRPITHGSALLIGVRDGGGSLRQRRGGEHRYFPVARGRVDWLGPGDVVALAGAEPFGEALLVDVRALPDAHGADERRRRGPEERVGHQDHGDSRALGGAEQDLLDGPWAGIGVDPDLHRDPETLPPSAASASRRAGSEQGAGLNIRTPDR